MKTRTLDGAGGAVGQQSESVWWQKGRPAAGTMGGALQGIWSVVEELIIAVPACLGTPPPV